MTGFVNNLLALFFLFLVLSFVDGRIHRLKLENDDRKQFTLSTFGFLKRGTLTVNVTKFSYEVDPTNRDYSPSASFGFTLDKSGNTGMSTYLESMQERCILSKKDVEDTDAMSVVFFRMDTKRPGLVVERKSKDLNNLVISTLSRKDFTHQHKMFRRNSDLTNGRSVMSDSFLLARTSRDVKNPVGKPISKVTEKPVVNNAPAAGASVNNAAAVGTSNHNAPAVGASVNNGPAVGASVNNVAAAKKMENKALKPDVAAKNPTKLVPQAPDGIVDDFIEMKRVGDYYTAYFLVYINRDTEEGLYNLFFHNCINYKGVNSAVNLSLTLIEENNGNYLSAGDMPLPIMNFVCSFAFFLSGCAWLFVLQRSSEDVYKMHYLMLGVVYVKSISCLFHAINFHFIETKGIHEEAWAILYYIVYLMRGALLFTTILLIGAGWAFIKHMLCDKEKKLFIIIIPLQVLANVAWIIVEESEEGQSQYTVWKEIFILVDLLCCGAILFPVVWSIRHLQDASQTDGKAEISLTKLKLFRQFYILIVCYIYFTRIIVYLLKITVPFKYEWLDPMFKEMATFIFFLVTGYKFRPASDNPYLQVPLDSDEEIEMEEVLTKNGALDTVVKVQRSKEQQPNSSTKQRESSHEYD